MHSEQRSSHPQFYTKCQVSVVSRAAFMRFSIRPKIIFGRKINSWSTINTFLVLNFSYICVPLKYYKVKKSGEFVVQRR